MHVHFIKKWLGPDRPAGLAVYASRAVTLDAAFQEAYARCVHAVEDVLGGTLESTDAAQGVIEARFGLLHSERITVSLERVDSGHTGVRIQARRGITAQPAPSSQYVDAMCAYLMSAPPK